MRRRVLARGHDGGADQLALFCSEEPLRSQVRAAFADSLKVVWQTCIGVVGFCCVLSLFMKSLPLATTTDEENWGLKDREKAAAHEREAAIAAPIVATV